MILFDTNIFLFLLNNKKRAKDILIFQEGRIYLIFDMKNSNWSMIGL